MLTCAKPADERGRPAFDSSLCSRCEKRTNQAHNPRSRMPSGHAVSTAESILIKRLDDRLEAIAGIVHEHMTEYSDADQCERLAIRIIQDVQMVLFPLAFSDGPAYEPDPSGRMDGPPVGLFSRRPAESPFVAALLAEERKRAAGQLRMKDGSSVFTDADLGRLAARREARAAAAV